MKLSVGRTARALFGALVLTLCSSAGALGQDADATAVDVTHPEMKWKAIPPSTNLKCHELRTRANWPKLKPEQRTAWIEANRRRGRRKVNYCLFAVTALQLKGEGVWTNTFSSWHGAQNVLLREPEIFWRVEGGYIDKKLIRDIWLIADPESYYNRMKDKKGRRKNTWAIDAFTVTAKGGYGRGLEERDITGTGAPDARSAINEWQYTLGAGYTVNFDKAFAGLD